MSKHAVREQARQVLNAYLTAELGHALLLDDANLIAKQRGNFLREDKIDHDHALIPHAG